MAADAKIGRAPCGHPGLHVIGQYVACPRCDVSSGVPLSVEPEATRRICPDCGDDNLKHYPAAMGFPERWWCMGCGKVF